jgi:hypothetical protein
MRVWSKGWDNADYPRILNRVIKYIYLNVTWVERIFSSSSRTVRRTHLLIINRTVPRPVFSVTNKGKTMINMPQRALIAIIITTFGIALPGAALAQSAYTTGTEASDVAAGYPSPYHGSGSYYAYAPAPVTAAAPVTAGGNAANCASRYHSYDPATGTYLGFDGTRHPCR